VRVARLNRAHASKSADWSESFDAKDAGLGEVEADSAEPDGVEQESSESIFEDFQVGKPFNPWRKVCGFYPPDVVARRRDLTDGQKRLYERAVRWAGKNGIFWHGFEGMADALGKSVRQLKDDMVVLESMGLIRHARRRRSSNVYSFLWHAMFEVRPTALQESTLKVQDPILKVQDSVILKVQPTAREFSPLELCPLNLVKGAKLITDDASQKPRSAASTRARAAHENLRTKKGPKADPMLTGSAFSSEDRERAAEWSPEELVAVRRRITEFWGREPEEGFEVSVMLRARGAAAVDVCELLDRKHANSKCREGGRWAPKNQNWFFAVIENEFTPGHLPEPPTAPPPPPPPLAAGISPRNERQREPAPTNTGIEVLELPDAPRSIVESVICSKCGRAALVRYRDGTIEGCGCRR
jgi:hypothetical protein